MNRRKVALISTVGATLGVLAIIGAGSAFAGESGQTVTGSAGCPTVGTGCDGFADAKRNALTKCGDLGYNNGTVADQWIDEDESNSVMTWYLVDVDCEYVILNHGILE